MPDFYEYIMRHGEFGVQSIIEQIERIEGKRLAANMTLEDRWNALKLGNAFQHTALAA